MEKEIIEQTIKSLERNHFEVYFANDRQEAKNIFFNEIFDKIKPTTISWGDSETMKATGILPEIEQHPECILIRTFQDGYSRAQKTYWRRQALHADLFVSGTNALTCNGQLVNVDMVGNRVAGITFGPEHVVLFIGTNKITDNLEKAMERIRTIAAPLNAIRHPHLHTPCQKTQTCMNCQSTDRLCNTWTITEKSFPQKRIKIILINEPLGL
ncbi:lactate utilization protein [Odoribacter sp. AF15-53]|uniref:lactate utilization protein n=1 Tax=Odoribacter sp. AF15-53 TaxID=2292236 RepID=UPI000E4C69F9|nr:lactate utilization protein [Odoribacter sp. AF15-53]RHR80855.1 lactate utilization protein [Odoribacter sp. AF15-53]